jgi:uncharacterized protein YpmB
MKLLPSLLLSILLATAACVAQPKQPTHATREQAIAHLRTQGILHGRDRVTYASWTGDFWIISLRHPDGQETNWSVDRYAQEAGYICKH